jgi:lysophospholipase L1-like esterase
MTEVIFRALTHLNVVEYPQPNFDEKIVHQYSEHKGLIYELRPFASAETVFGPIETNQHGLRDHEYSLAKPPDTLRICVIGDSVTFGLHLFAQDTYPKILERTLNSTYGHETRFEVLNFAVGGYNSYQEEIVLKEKCLKFDPDMVLVGFCLNDDEYTKGLGALAREMSPHSLGTRLHSKLISYLLYRYERANMQNWDDMGKVDHFFETLSELRTEGLEALILVFPYYFENLNSYSELGKHKKVNNIAERHNLPVIDFIDAWDEFDSETRKSFYNDGKIHFSKQGMEQVATGVFEYLQKNLLIINDQDRWIISLEGKYDTEDFEGLTQVPDSETRKDFYEHYSGWLKYRDYVIARDLGVTLSKSIHPIPPGDYQVLLKVYDHEGQGSNQVEVTLNGMSQIIEWSGTEEGEKWVGATFENQSGGSELTITSLKREQWFIEIFEVAVIPVDKGEERVYDN